MTHVRPLRYRAASSVGWSLVRFGGDQFFNFIIFAILARLLSPAQFGVFVISVAFAEFGKILAQAGLVSSLFRVPKLTDELADTVFWANLALGLMVAALGLLLCRSIAAALGEASAAPIIATIGFTVPIAALGASHMARNLRQFGHRSLALRSLLAGLIGGGLAICAAAAGYGVWALVVQRFTAEIINTAIAWRAFQWRPRLRFSWLLLREQLALGGTMAMSQLLQLALARSQDVILARTIGLSAVGTYRTAWKTVELISQGVITPFSTVAVPALAKLQFDMHAFERGYLKMIRASAIFSFPAIVGVGVLADQIIPLAYGSRWQASVPVAQVLAFLVLPFALNFFADPAMLVLRQTRSMLALTVVQLAGTLLFCIVAAPYGLVAVAIAYVTRAYLTLGLQLWLVRRASGIRIAAVLGSIAPQLCAAALMGVVLGVGGRLLPPTGGDGAHRILRLGTSVMIGATVYGGALMLLLGAKQRAALWETAISILQRRPVTAAE